MMCKINKIKEEMGEWGMNWYCQHEILRSK